VELTEITISSDRVIQQDFAPKLRGFFGNYYRDRFEFHHHLGERLLYRHPLIQYKVIGGSAVLTGINEGAFLLRVIDQFKELKLGAGCYRVIRQNAVTRKVDIGIRDNTNYRFLSPWFALNESNYKEYCKISDSTKKARTLLNRILIGNLLSFSKSIGYTADEQIEADFTIENIEPITAKNSAAMLAFKGSFRSNFHLPDLWGIGKLSSMGFGVVKREC